MTFDKGVKDFLKMHKLADDSLHGTKISEEKFREADCVAIVKRELCNFSDFQEEREKLGEEIETAFRQMSDSYGLEQAKKYFSSLVEISLINTRVLRSGVEHWKEIMEQKPNRERMMEAAESVNAAIYYCENPVLVITLQEFYPNAIRLNRFNKTKLPEYFKKSLDWFVGIALLDALAKKYANQETDLAPLIEEAQQNPEKAQEIFSR